MKIKIESILDLNHTISRDLFMDNDEIWEVIPKIKDYIIKIKY